MRARTADRRRDALRATTRPRAPGILLGIGLGGFVDGIVLHQILQWHHMLTSEGGYPKTTVAGLETNTLWDGLFHVSTWIAVAIGVYVLWRRTTDWRWAISGRALAGWMLVGWACSISWKESWITTCSGSTTSARMAIRRSGISRSLRSVLCS